jgi:hypothetical protein
MVVRFEMFHTGQVAPERLWGVVGDPWRLAEWTDVESVADVSPDPPVLGTRITTVEAGTTREWQITTLEARLMEMWTTTERGTMGVGCRVVRDARGGSRLVLAAGVEIRGRAGDLRARLFDGPALRRRMDRWSAEAVRVATMSR